MAILFVEYLFVFDANISLLYPLIYQANYSLVTIPKSFDDIETWRNEFLLQSRIYINAADLKDDVDSLRY